MSNEFIARTYPRAVTMSSILLLYVGSNSCLRFSDTSQEAEPLHSSRSQWPDYSHASLQGYQPSTGRTRQAHSSSGESVSHPGIVSCPPNAVI